MNPDAPPMTINLEPHAEAILRPLGLKLEHISPHLHKPILTACAALFDAGALAMRDKCAQEMASSFRLGNTLRSLERAIAAIDPATLRTGGSHD